MKIKTRDMILVALFSGLMAVGAHIKMLFPVIPLSFQTFFCAFSGIMLGARLGALSQAVYVALGLAGMPVFTQGGGPLYILKPTFGFLLGFILGAYVIGKVFESLKKHSFWTILLSMLSGLLALNLVGLSYLYTILKYYMNKPDTTLMYVLSIGLFPFILKDLVMYIIAAVVANMVMPCLRKSGITSCRT